jgi:uncharacterized membrane protein (UPF0127 family)
MRHLLVINRDRAAVPPVKAKSCTSFLCQLRGLTFRRSLAFDEGLLLVQKRDGRIDAAIHMFGVFIDLAVVWIDSTDEVVDVRLAKAWRSVMTPRRPARYVLEINASRIDDFRVGERVEFQEQVTK